MGRSRGSLGKLRVWGLGLLKGARCDSDPFRVRALLTFGCIIGAGFGDIRRPCGFRDGACERVQGEREGFKKMCFVHELTVCAQGMAGACAGAGRGSKQTIPLYRCILSHRYLNSSKLLREAFSRRSWIRHPSDRRYHQIHPVLAVSRREQR